MELILRAVILYFLLLIIFRMSGKRTLSEMTTFDFILLLIIGEATQQALLRNDHSIVGALLVIATLISLDMMLAVFSRKSRLFDKIANGIPVIILENGTPIKDRMNKQEIEIDDILQAARTNQGLESLDQIKYAVLEKDGKISIIPKHKNPAKIKAKITSP